MSLRSMHVLAAAALCLAIAIVPGARAQTTVPNNLTEAQLYELAKKESGALLITGMPYAVAKVLGADFEKKYPGVKLDIIYLVGLELYQRFALETKNNQHLIDIMHINDYPSMKSLVEQGNIAAWKVPSAERFGKYRIGDAAYSLYFTDVVAMYNETRVSDDEAKMLERWEWATDPRFKGRFGVAIQRCSTCYAPMQVLLDPQTSAKTYGWPFLEKIADNKPGIYRNTDFMGDRVAAGEKDIAFTEAEGYAFGQRYRGAPVRWKIPSPAPSFPNAWIGNDEGISRPPAAHCPARASGDGAVARGRRRNGRHRRTHRHRVAIDLGRAHRHPAVHVALHVADRLGDAGRTEHGLHQRPLEGAVPPSARLRCRQSQQLRRHRLGPVPRLVSARLPVHDRHPARNGRLAGGGQPIVRRGPAADDRHDHAAGMPPVDLLRPVS